MELKDGSKHRYDEMKPELEEIKTREDAIYVPAADVREGFRMPLMNGKWANLPKQWSKNFTSKNIVAGTFPNNILRAQAKKELEAIKYAHLVRLAEKIKKEALTPEEFARLIEHSPKSAKHYAVFNPEGKIIDERAKKMLADARRKTERGDELRFTTSEKKNLDRVMEQYRDEVFTSEDAVKALNRLEGEDAKGVLFYDTRKLGNFHKDILNIDSFLGSARLAAGMDTVSRAAITSLLLLKPGYLTPNLAGQVFLGMDARQLGSMEHGGDRAHGAEPEPRRTAARCAASSASGSSKVSTPRRGSTSPSRCTPACHCCLTPRSATRRSGYEARKLGYNSKNINELFTPAKRADLDEVSQRANAAMIDYARLTPRERGFVRRIVMFYPFLKGSGMYAGRLPREHPVKTAVLGAIGDLGQERIGELGDLPAGLDALIPYSGEADFEGNVTVGNPAAVQMLDTPIRAFESIAGVLGGRPEVGQGLLSFASPGVSIGAEGLFGLDPFFGGETQEAQEDKNLLQRLAAAGEGYAPAVPAVKGKFMGEADETGLIQRTPGQEWNKFLLGGIAGQQLNLERAAATVARNTEKGTREQQEAARVDNKLAEFLWKVERIPNQTLNPQAMQTFQQAFEWRKQREVMKAELTKEVGRGLTDMERLGIALTVAVQAGKLTEQNVSQILQGLQSIGSEDGREKQAMKIGNQVIDKLLGGSQLEAIGKVIRGNGMDWKLNDPAVPTPPTQPGDVQGIFD